MYHRAYQNRRHIAASPVSTVSESLAALADARRVYNDLDARRQQIVRSINADNDRRGVLTSKQVALLGQFVAHMNERKEQVTLSFSNIFGAMQHARTNGNLKQPRMTFRFERGRLALRYDEPRNSTQGYVGVYQNNIYVGRIDPSGAAVFKPFITAENIDFIRELDVSFFEVAAREGKRMGACCFCTRTLTDPVSLEHGYGPICARHYRTQISFHAASAPSQIGRV